MTTIKQMPLRQTDGGRSQYFTANSVCDCVTRAIAIATSSDYKEVYDKIRSYIGHTPRNGIKNKDVRKLMEYFGGTWHTCMTIGSGCHTHMNADELPTTGTIICNLSKHVSCVIDGVIHDTFDQSRNGMRCVYGYWIF